MKTAFDPEVAFSALAAPHFQSAQLAEDTELLLHDDIGKPEYFNLR